MPSELTIGSLFSGIGGLELGLEWAGHGPVAWQVERDPFCRRVLAKHWPDVERFDDVCAVGAAQLVPVDIICGGFPCQDVSSAGDRAGLAGERSGLWREFARIIGELRSPWVAVENVASGAGLWLDVVVRDLEQLGYETLPLPISAADVGAPHLRRRIFVVAHLADSVRVDLRIEPGGGSGARGSCSPESRDDGSTFPVAVGVGHRERARPEYAEVAGAPPLADANGARRSWPDEQQPDRRNGPTERAWADDAMPRPALCRVDDGPAAWLHRGARVKALGNAVVPQCAQVVGEVINLLRRGNAA